MNRIAKEVIAWTGYLTGAVALAGALHFASIKPGYLDETQTERTSLAYQLENVLTAENYRANRDSTIALADSLAGLVQSLPENPVIQTEERTVSNKSLSGILLVTGGALIIGSAVYLKKTVPLS